MPVGYSHIFLRKVASYALAGFFKEIHIIGDENVPKDGPLIVCCTHHNMMIDPGILSNTMPDLRPVRYWAKASLFASSIGGKILLDAGNIPVDRGSKDNQKLFAGTFGALSQDDAVALFPEGTSYTLPRIVQVKDGASWAALEYIKWVANGGENVNKGKELIIVPAGITYTDKTKYRSSAVIEYGRPIPVSKFKQQFLSTKEGESRLAVKALTHEIEKAMIELTINAPNWEALLAAKNARDLLYDSWRGVKLDDFRSVGQTLVDLFSTPWDSDPEFVALKRALITYHSLLKATRLSNDALATLPLSRTKKSSQIPVPSRLSTVLPLLRETFAVLIRLPFFLVPLLIHLPIYYTTRWVGDRSAAEEETVAQGKVAVGLGLIFALYGFWFWVIWAFFFLTPIGAVVAAATVYGMASYHGALIDDNYLRAKRLLSAYRVLVGVWGPQRWDMALSNLSQYTITTPPPPNPYLKLPESVKEALSRSTSSPTIPTISTISKPETTGTTTSEPAVAKPTSSKRIKNKRPPSRKLVRHLLRARAEAARRLAAFLKKINQEGVRVAASGFMAAEFGGGQESLFTYPTTVDSTGAKVVPGGVEAELNPSGWRRGKEVVAYLESKGARIGKFIREQEGDEEYEWEALRTDGYSSPGSPGSPSDVEPPLKEQDLDWVVPVKK